MNPENTKSPEQQFEILSRGIKDFIGREELLKKLKKGKTLIVKAGFDPSRPDLHLGHSLLINKLRQFQELGHEVNFVVGDFTACIGDPSGQNKTRPALTFEESKKNAQTYKEQACKENFKSKKELSENSQKVFEFFKRLDPQKTKIVFNSNWFENISLRDFILNIASRCTLARQLERDDFKKRFFKDKKPIALHELFYPLLQAYDSVELKADVEIGGTDQLFNLLLGRQLQEDSGQAPQAILTLPLLQGINAKIEKLNKNWNIEGESRNEEKEDRNEEEENWNIEGADKMSKSLDNAISFNDSPKDMYGKVMRISDELLDEWWNLFTEGEDDLRKYELFRPKAQKEELAWLLVCSFYGEEQADKEKETFKNKLNKIEEKQINSNNKSQEMIDTVKKRKERKERKKWLEIHDLKAYLLYKKKKTNEKRIIMKELCRELSNDEDFKEVGISSNSILKKYYKYKYLNTGEGFKKASKQSREIHNKYKNYSISVQSREIHNKYKNYSISVLDGEIKKIENQNKERYENLSRGARYLIDEKDFLKKLKENRPLKIKVSFDPSQPDLHLGHSLLINKLRQFQKLGHKINFVMGDWTAYIEDLSSQNKKRLDLSFEKAQKNAENYKKQFCKKNFKINKDIPENSQKVFNFFKRLDSKETEIVFDSKWFKELSLRKFILDIVSKQTLVRHLERDDFKKRFDNEKPIFLHELFYSLLKAYSSVKLETDVEIGGIDQDFNLFLGRQLQETFGQKPQVILTLPLLKPINANIEDENEDKEDKNEEEENWDKMSKNLDNAISFNESPKDMYGKVMSISDNLLVRWWNLFTEGEDDLRKYESFRPKAQKEELAWLLVCSFYGEEQANQEKETFKKERTGKNIPEDMEEQEILSQGEKEQNVPLVDLLLELKLVSSKSEARRKILEGATRILKDEARRKIVEEANKNSNNEIIFTRNDMEKITDPNYTLNIKKGQEITVSLGKRKFKRINTKWKEIHDLKVYWVHRKIEEGKDKDKLCEKLSQEELFKDYISVSSIKMKTANYKFLDTGGTEGLSNVSRQSEEIYEKYKTYPISQIEQAIKKLEAENQQSERG